MPRILTILVLLTGIFLTACRSSQKFQAAVAEDKPLFAAINELVKHPDNAKAQNDLRYFYQQTTGRHEAAIAAWRNSTDDKRWDKILNELNALQHIYTSVQAVPGAFSIVQPKNYIAELQATREEAAENFYRTANEVLTREGRESSLEAYTLFTKVNSYVNGYKDVEKLTKEAYAKSVVDVVVNPIEDDNIFYTTWNNTGLRYRPEDYQESLVRELGGRNANRVPARFYTDRDARRENIDADWVVDVRWRNVNANTSMPYRYTRQVSRSVKVGTDTSGKAIYKTVYATLSISQRTITVQGDLDYRINDIVHKENVDQGMLSDQISWTESYATYSGDSRALSGEDWAMIRNRSFDYGPSKSDVMNSLMRRLYPDLRRRLEQAIS